MKPKLWGIHNCNVLIIRDKVHFYVLSRNGLKNARQVSKNLSQEYPAVFIVIIYS